MHLLIMHYVICRLSRELKVLISIRNVAPSLTKRETPLFCGFLLDLDLIQLHSFCKPSKKIAKIISDIWRKLKNFFCLNKLFYSIYCA